MTRSAPHPGGSSIPRQRTIGRPAVVSGIGIHTGTRVDVTCHPAPVDHGIVFARTDPDARPVRASLQAVADTRRGVTLGAGSSSVRTVEHLLAAAAGMGISNLLVKVRGEELPALDGSVAPYCQLWREAGLSEQDADWHPLVLRAPLWVEASAASVLAVPASAFRITYVVPLHHRVLDVQAVDVTVDLDRFVAELAPARTWGFASDMEKLRRQGLAAGASLQNALGIGPDGYLNPPRMSDEPARHKVLDLIGDLALLGRPLRAHVIAVGAGHGLHLDLAHRLAQAGGSDGVH